MCQTLDAANAAIAASQNVDLTGANPRDEEFVSTLVRPDPSSWANHSSVKVNHYDMKFKVDFTNNVITGDVTYTVEALVADPKVISLDFKGQTISAVIVDEKPADYWISHVDGKLGQSLVIRLPTLAIGEKSKIVITMKTGENASALQWLLPEQTATKKHPYLFTQCQAIHCRSVIPCQDSPGVKSSYTASITVPKDLIALMSAVIDNPEGELDPQDQSLKIFTFQQKVPIPSYLIALAVGELEKVDISDRCAVWSDPLFVKTCAEELSELDTMIQKAEELNGPYIWGRYDVLVLPASFPYGGMENPCLTFATPSIIAGDKSLVNVILHEAQHSWSGNLVTNDTWESFFLNEGFTIFGERKLVERIYGKEQRGLHTAVGWEGLKKSVADFGHDHPFTCLQVDLSDEKDPDDSFSVVPYEKGFTFLAYLESVVSVEVMEKFLKAYYSEYAHNSINSDIFIAYFKKFVTSQGVTEEQLSKIDWNTWLYAPGMPQPVPFDDSLTIKTKEFADLIYGSRIANPILNSENQLKDWSASQKTIFLDTLNEKVRTLAIEDPIQYQRGRHVQQMAYLRALDHIFGKSTNAELQFRFLTLAVRLGSEEREEDLKNFLSGIGRMKFVGPLYADLFYSEIYRDFAVELFSTLKTWYHPICSKKIEKDMKRILQEPTRY